MTSTTSHHNPLDYEAMRAYVAWCEECIGVWDAYTTWSAAGAAEASAAFTGYTVALDREERAAALYINVIRRGGSRYAAPREPATPLAASGKPQQ